MPGPKTNERPGTRAVLRHARVAPNKVREVLNLVRDRPVHEAEDILRFSERDVAFLVAKVLNSAVANAEHNDDAEREELYVAACFADEGTTIKRWRPRARGRATRIRKRTSHITVIVSRLPDDRLRRLQAHRRAEQLAERARRVAGARYRRAGATGGDEGDTPSRSARRRRRGSAEEVTSATDEAGIVDSTGAGVAALEEATASEQSEATASEDTEVAETTKGADAGPSDAKDASNDAANDAKDGK